MTGFFFDGGRGVSYFTNLGRRSFCVSFSPIVTIDIVAPARYTEQHNGGVVCVLSPATQHKRLKSTE